MNKQEYFLGLDMGTNSVGWAVSDTQYNIIKRHGKALWGIRLFDEAQTAEDRRQHRIARRRTERSKERIDLLQEIMAPEICKMDPGFFHRLNESRYWPEDKKNEDGTRMELPYALFSDKEYTDVDYHKEYPTIYHLRSELIHSDKPHDPRLVYLAVHHIIKHRGHFLFDGVNVDSDNNFHLVWSTFLNTLINIQKDEERILDCVLEDEGRIEEILKNQNKTKTDKERELKEIIGGKDKQQKEFAKLLAGGLAKLSNLCDDTTLDDACIKKIALSDSKFDEKISDLQDALEDRYIVIEAAKAVYDWSVLVTMLGEHQYYSDAKMAIYEKHKSDLAAVKRALRNDKETYNLLFGIPKEKITNYSSYVGVCEKKDRIEKKCTREDFYDFVKKQILDKLPEELRTAIKADMEVNNFMPKQVTGDNGVIPNQLHAKELKEILNHAEKYMPFLSEKDDAGYTNREKIEKILTFRRPYYVGPINTHANTGMKRSNCWSVRRKDGKVYPWNFEEMIDLEASAQNFIQNMTNACTYLVGEEVLPKESILYSKFMVLDELNNLKVNGEPISVEIKQKIFKDLCLTQKKVTGQSIKKWLKVNAYPYIECTDKGLPIYELSGIDGDLKNGMKSYIDLQGILSGTNLQQKDLEQIIMDITLFHDDKNLLRKRLHALYEQLTEGQIDKLSNLPYEGWGRLSGKFLEGITSTNPETGECEIPFITMLWETNDNHMQLLSSRYQYAEKIREWNQSKQEDGPIRYETIQEMYLSPSVKRPVWQTVKIVKEIVKIMGCEPKRVFVEVARENNASKKGQRTVSRRQTLLDLYKACKEDSKELIESINGVEDEGRFRSDRLYLYYTQRGICPYCGQPMEFEKLNDSNIYDIDHIYPQSKVMDDSLDNRVLSHKTCNKNKTDVYPIRPEIQEKMQSTWRTWEQQGLISKEKFNRLIRKTAFSEEELAGFIARQLVETRQSTKAVAELMQRMLPETEVVYSKAAVVSQFRHDFNLIKVREVNDYHHAKDAYLNIVCGNVYHVKFTKDAMKYIHQDTGHSYNIRKMFINGKDIERNGEIAWKGCHYEEEKENGQCTGTIATIKKQMRKNNILYTGMVHDNVPGPLFDTMPVKKGKGQVPLKGNDERLLCTQKYGAYNKPATAYFMIVRGTNKKGNETTIIISIPKNNVLQQGELDEISGLKNTQILVPHIGINALFEMNGYRMRIAGKNGEAFLFRNSEQLILPYETELFLKKIKKRKDNGTYFKDIEEEMLNKTYQLLASKLKESIFSKRPNNQCDFINESYDKFKELEIKNKVNLLLEILHVFDCTAETADLREIKGVQHAGIISISDLSKRNSVKMINQSITGFYEKVTDVVVK